MKSTIALLVCTLAGCSQSGNSTGDVMDVVQTEGDAFGVDVPAPRCPPEQFWISLQTAQGSYQQCLPIGPSGLVKYYLSGEGNGSYHCAIQGYSAGTRNFALPGETSARTGETIVSWGFPTFQTGLNNPAINPFRPEGSEALATILISTSSTPTSSHCSNNQQCWWRSACSFSMHGTGLVDAMVTVQLTHPCTLPYSPDGRGASIELLEFQMQAVVRRGPYLLPGQTGGSLNHNCP